jgi:hypothetical protein
MAWNNPTLSLRSGFHPAALSDAVVVYKGHSRTTADLREGLAMQEEFVIDGPQQQSYLLFIINALGWRYTFLLPLAALVSFALILLLVLRGRGTSLSAGLILLVPLPFLVGIMGFVDGLVASFQVIAMSDTAPKPSALATGLSMSFVTIWIGILLTIPGYLLAVIGTIVRTVSGDTINAQQATAIPAKVIESNR